MTAGFEILTSDWEAVVLGILTAAVIATLIVFRLATLQARDDEKSEHDS